ncbi:cytochrome P450 [Streptomyces sp. NPDC050560]|uniref:cytochrome P450 n=1 Tax=Streptomyces sp. NPDC050560 TaxID=3365630 RepID=UPI003796E3D8
MNAPTDESRVSARELTRDPHGVYARLRESSAVCPVSAPGGAPAWLVTRYADVARALADPRLSLDKRHAADGYRGFDLPPALDRNLLNMDGDDHARVRRLAAQAFTPARAERLRPAVQRAADALLDTVERRLAATGGGAPGITRQGGGEGTVPAETGEPDLADPTVTDLVATYAAPLPTVVICEILGVPEGDRPDFRRWTEAMVAPDPTNPDGIKQAVGGLWAYFGQLIAAKRAAPGDDLLSDLIAAHEAADHLTGDELTSLAFLLLTAGFENTALLIANAVLTLLTHPDQLALLLEQPDLIPGAVDELARFEGPAPVAIRRFATEDCTIGDVTVPKGGTVLVSLASANRDPEHFTDPDTLDVRRADSSHLALGRGPHYCLGAPLARVETETALAALLRRFPRLALAAPADAMPWRDSMRSRGLKRLPVRLVPAP